MRRLTPLLSLNLATVLALAGSRSAAADAPAFAHEASDLAPDPATRFGKLPNGMRYVIRRNIEPRERASLRLLVEVGSLHETDRQRGLAHFLEHMAFNGSTNYPADTLVDVFQRMGMNFGGDSNASTGFDRTTYMFELPDTREETFAEAFKVFGDYAAGLLLDTEEIDKERGVILSEERSRDSVDYRTFIAGFEFELGGTLFPERMPIGKTEVIQTATREDFVDYYETWYRPEKMTLIAVGDFDPDAVERQVRATFGSLEARAPARPEPDFGTIRDARGLQVEYHYEPEAPATTIGISTITPYSYEQDNSEKRLKYLPRSLAISMLNRRFEILSKEEDATFTDAGAYSGESFHFLHSSGIEITARPGQWRGAMATAEQELRRALQHGFQEAELREVVANLTNSLEQSVRTASTRRSSSFADEIAATLIGRSVFTTPETDMALLAPAVASITVEDCVEALREAWDAPHRYIFVAGNAVISEAEVASAAEEAAERMIAATWEESGRVAVEAPAAIAESSWAYTDFGEPGTVARRERVEDLDATLVTFSNGLRLNLKRTDFEASRIRIGVRIGTGELTQPADRRGLGFFIDEIFSAGGLGQHSADDLDRILAGRTLGFGFSVGGDALSVGATTNPDDLDLQFQLITAYLTDPGYREEAVRQAHRRLDEFYIGMEHELGAPLQTEVQQLLASGDPRFGLPSREEVFARTVEEARTWLTPQLERGAIEVTAIGDLDVDATIAAVARTLGALPSREARPDLSALRAVRIPEPFERSYTVDTEIPKGVVVFYWPTFDEDAISENRRLAVLATVLDDRMRAKVREELGGAYSPAAGNSPSGTYADYGFMQANVIVEPGQEKMIGDAILEISEDLSRDGVTEDELVRAKQPILTQLRESDRTNTYWGRVLSRAQEKPVVMEWSRTRYTDFESITKAEVDALARQLLAPGRAFRVTVLPRDLPATPAAEPLPPAGN
jgi:zinc protease